MNVDLVPLAKDKVEEWEGALLPLPAADIKTIHSFAPGMYIREMHVPADTVVIGHEHLTDQINILLKGSLDIVVSEGQTAHMMAPCYFVARAGIRKVAEFHEDSVWLNVMPNPDNEHDIAVLDDRFVRKSATFMQHQKKLSEATPNPSLI